MLLTILVYIVAILIGSGVGGTALWLGSRLTKDQVSWLEALVISFAATLCMLLPYGGFIGLIVMLLLLRKWCGCDIWPGGILLVIVTGVFQFGLYALFIKLLSTILS